MIGSPWRKLTRLAAGLLAAAGQRRPSPSWPPVGSASHRHRYVTETVALLAARSPKLRQALRDAKKAGHAYLVLDGTLIPIDRVAADRPFTPASTASTG